MKMSTLSDHDDSTQHENEHMESLPNINTEQDDISDENSDDSEVENMDELENNTLNDSPEFMKQDAQEEKVGKGNSPTFADEDSIESDESDDEEDNSLKKLEMELHRDILLTYHPEIKQQNYNEVLALCKLSRDMNGNIVDPLHRTLPFLSKYERARVLGMRAKQLNTGSDAFVDIPKGVMDGLIIAKLELEQGKIPYIIRRPLPNGQSEYWKLNDLEDIYY